MKRIRKNHMVKLIALIITASLLASFPVFAADETLRDLPTEWDVTQFYADEDAFNKEMDHALELVSVYDTYRGTLNNKEGLLKYLKDEKLEELSKIINKASMYSEALNAKNASDPLAARVKARLRELKSKEDNASAFVNTELMELPLKEREELFSDPELAPYAYYYRKLVDPDTVALDEKTQITYNLMSDATSKYEETYNVFDAVELPRPTITMPDGKKETLTDILAGQILNGDQYDHALKEEALKLRTEARYAYENTYASLLEGAMKSYQATAKVYGFDSALDFALYESDVTLPEHIGSDWARIPHMYYHYYVYQYATSLTYAAAICQKIDSGEKDAVSDYLKFLKLGGSASPADLLKTAGVDPMDDQTYEAAYEYFKGMIDEYKALTE